jgi:hypothetical protein
MGWASSANTRPLQRLLPVTHAFAVHAMAEEPRCSSAKFRSHYKLIWGPHFMAALASHLPQGSHQTLSYKALDSMNMQQTIIWGPAESSFSCTAHPLLAMLLDSQSKPSYRPSPDVAHVLWMYLLQQQLSGLLTGLSLLIADSCI